MAAGAARTAQKAMMRTHVALYRLLKGRFVGRAFGVENVLLTTTGRRTGRKRTTPLVVTADGNRLVLVASSGGAAHHPDWYHNLTADPHVSVQRGGTATEMTARTATAAERAVLWPKVLATYKGYEGYQRKTSREIPLVICEPTS